MGATLNGLPIEHYNALARQTVQSIRSAFREGWLARGGHDLDVGDPAMKAALRDYLHSINVSGEYLEEGER